MKRCVGFFIFLFYCGLISAQEQPAETLQQQFTGYHSNNIQEKLFIHTDKTFYLAGETVWFKIYAVDASWHKPFASSCISYIEIINREGKAVVQSKVALIRGSGSGSIILPGFLISGNYILRAYTNWMKNFSPDFYFEQTLQIVNTLKTAPVSAIIKLPAVIQFFPEGGQTVYGFQQKIAFKATDGYGRGLDCQGAIVNQQNDTITRFQSFHNGMGTFLLRSEKNNYYFAILRLNDSLIRQKLPDAEDRGFVMNLAEEEGGKLRINVRATPDLNNAQVYLFAQTRQLIKNVQTSLLKNGETTFLIDKKDLGEGISSITLFNQSRQPVCERLIFKRPEAKLLIQAKADQAVYNNRKPVNIDLATTDASSQVLPGNCSVSVFMIDSLQPVPEQNIISYLYLSSDLKGKIESPGYYFRNTDKASDEALDNLLLTQGWRRFNWNEVLENKKSYFEFLPEIEGSVVNGKIINKLTGTPVGNSVALLSVPGADYAFSSATSDANGLVRFGFREIFANNAIVTQPALLKDSNYRIDISSAWSDKFSNSPVPILTVSRDQEAQLLNRSISNQVENTYGMDKKRRYVKDNLDTTSFYGIPDRIYNLDDFTHFQTMEEVIREYVEDVRVRREGNHFIFKVRNRLFGTYFEEDPLILLDGIPVSDATKVIGVDPAKIKRIEVVMHNYYVGSSVYAGIVNVKSYGGDVGATQIDPNALVVEYGGLQQQRIFYSPSYSTETGNHLPDFRNVLFWAPQIVTDSVGKSRLTFYTSDLKGKFAVVAQGISADGQPGATVSFFEVNDAK